MKKFAHILFDIITLKWFFWGLVKFYQICISPILPSACIYVPSCSNYMIIALKKHGVIRGIPMGICRILRCVPWRQGGADPVPDNPKGDMKWLM